MVADNPLFHGTWTWKRFNSTVIDDIWADVFFFTLVATMVTTISELTPHKLAVSNQLLTVLGTVLGLVISFRTTTAYTGYQDGRRMWTNIMIGTRNLAQLIWIHVPNERKDKAKDSKDNTSSSSDDSQEAEDEAKKKANLKILESVLEKKSVINLIQAFAVSVKHFLRGEPGVFYRDLYPLIAFLPRYASVNHHDVDMLPLWAACHTSGSLPAGVDEFMPANRNPRAVVDNKDHRPIQRTSSEPTHGDLLPLTREETITSARPKSNSAPASMIGHGNMNRSGHQHGASTSSDNTLFESQHLLSPLTQSPELGNTKPRPGHFLFIPKSPPPKQPSSPDSPTPTLVGSPRRRRKAFDPEKALPDISCHRDLNPARTPPTVTIYDYIPLFKAFRWVVRAVTKKNLAPNGMAQRSKRKKLNLVESNVPLEILMYLSSYTAFVMQNGLVQPAIATGLYNNLTLLQDTLSNLERIRNTPLPFAYQAHLRMSLWLYLLFLPFQIYTAFGWWTIPTTTFASFLYLGFLEIGQEIENPFAYDLNDLDVDGFCLAIQRELHEIAAFINPSDPSSYLLNQWNHPLAPSDRRNALDIMKSVDDQGRFKMAFGGLGSTGNRDERVQGMGRNAHNPPEAGIPSIRRVLVANWKEVDTVTRKH